MKIQNSTIGIWGFGRVGQAAASFFHARGARIIVYDDNAALTAIPYLTASSLDVLLQSTDYLLPSPGIDIRNYYASYAGHWICEVDIMHAFFKKPIIAITGSVGKTTTTHILAHLLQQQGIKTIAAGNIGIPMLSLIDQQDSLDIAVLELSSFQLEYAQSFAPQLALWTNLYPNHLDRHGSIDGYFKAKLPIVKQQTRYEQALVPLYLRDYFAPYNLSKNPLFFSKECNPLATFCLDHHEVHHHPSQRAIALDAFPATTFIENWLLIWAAFYLLKIPYPLKTTVAPLEHRLEKVTEINGITFYNDSKSTTPTSTLAALEQFKEQRIVLFLGGLSKGIDRSPLIHALRSYAIQVFSFGKESSAIKALCDSFSIACSNFNNLEDAFMASTQTFKNHTCVLFSPSGSSYDLFKNYEERGTTFKKLVHEYKKNCS